MGRAEEIERLKEKISVLEESIKRREESKHPEKYVNCLANDKFLVKKLKGALEELEQGQQHRASITGLNVVQ